MTDAKDDPLILSTHTETERGIETTVMQGYQAPLDGTFDEYALADQSLAKDVAEVLKSTYPGYPWHVMSEIKQGYVAFRLPELMGATLFCFIRIADKDRIGKKIILDTAGNLLERMGLPRGRCDLDAYRAAKKRLHTFEFDDVARKQA